MSAAISFVICMEPVPKGRPRFYNGRAMTPEKTRRFERDFRLASRKYAPPKPWSGGVELTLLFQIKKPISVNRDWPSVRPDIDNYVKAVQDSLGDFIGNDGQVIRLYARKRYGLMPLIKVEISRPGESRFERIDAILDEQGE